MSWPPEVEEMIAAIVEDSSARKADSGDLDCRCCRDGMIHYEIGKDNIVQVKCSTDDCFIATLTPMRTN